MEYKLGVVESHFADIVWKYEPISSKELVKRCEEELNWKRTTTYTVLKKLGERGFFQLQDGVVTALIKKEEYGSMQSQRFVEETFKGSLPLFIAAFTKQKALSKEEVEQIHRLIDQAEEV